MIKKVLPSVSLIREIVPELVKDLTLVGFAVLEIDIENKNEKQLETDMLVLITMLGQHIGKEISYYSLEGTDSNVRLSAHVEGIYASIGITDYFALGCITASQTGGETRLFDARVLADEVEKIIPHAKDILIEYTSTSYPDQRAQYHLVDQDTRFGKVLRYRAGNQSNRLISSHQEISLEHIQSIMTTLLDQHVLVRHKWKPGQILFVNNKITLHDREPYTGNRKMLRVRFGDYLNTKFTY
jgi:hypothetical protein